MKRLREIITNPVGIAIAVVHWIFWTVIVFSSGIPIFQIRKMFRWLDSPSYDLLISSNFFPLLIVNYLLIPFLSTTQNRLFVESLILLTFFIMSNFQWLLIGYFISRFISSHRQLEKVNFSLKNE